MRVWASGRRIKQTRYAYQGEWDESWIQHALLPLSHTMLISACHIVKFIVYSHGMSKVSTANVSAQFNLPFEKEAMISYQKDVKNLPKKKTRNFPLW